MTILDTNEVVILLRSLQGTIEEGRLKANQLRKQERYETSKEKSSEEVMEMSSRDDILLPVQALLNRITKVCFYKHWIEVVKLQQPVITISAQEYY